MPDTHSKKKVSEKMSKKSQLMKLDDDASHTFKNTKKVIVFNVSSQNTEDV